MLGKQVQQAELRIQEGLCTRSKGERKFCLHLSSAQLGCSIRFRVGRGGEGLLWLK